MYKVLLLLDKFFLIYEGGVKLTSPPQKKLPSKSPALPGLSKTASARILGSRVNQTDVSNTNNIFTPSSTPVNLEEDQPEQDFN